MLQKPGWATFDLGPPEHELCMGAAAQASNRAFYVYQALEDAASALSAAGAEGDAAVAEAEHAFAQAAGAGAEAFLPALASLRDDLNTPQALAHLSEPLKRLNDLLHTKKVRTEAQA
jgi:cysteinyl-tRNA synthetase